MNMLRMKNAIKTLWGSEVLAFFSAVMLGLSAIAAILFGTKEIFAGMGISLLLGLMGSIASLAAFIMELIALNNASKDNEKFKKALYVVCAGIVISLLLGFFQKVTIVNTIDIICSGIVNILYAYFVVEACLDLCPNLSETGKKCEIIVITTLFLSLVFDVMNNFIESTVGVVISAIYVLVAAIAYYFLITFLTKVNNELGNLDPNPGSFQQ